MHPVLKNVLNSDDLSPLSDFTPSDTANFCVHVSMMIGEKGKEGEESFDIIICSPKWLQENTKNSDIFFTRHYLIAGNYDYKNIYDFITKSINKVTGKNWKEVGEKLSRIGHWEFEDYQTSDIVS